MAHSHSGQIRVAVRLLSAAALLCCLLFACASAEDASLFTCVTNILNEPGEVYVSLTGDQCAITDIHTIFPSSCSDFH